ncbi:thiol:disulfide interchange protein DsbD [Silvibacterium bohemicum]|uniref:Thiol:disulfide interchange protein DsbD n=1 Tax=Silvibacterium bohemicum TaxID=1577686 RepID=A0A841K3N4_9BACT|nr:protein-disulfide reductase DsbD domain-containing protein [Silvibacterium bohemicum]MBB6145248.1 thiol:disulfide interchange protein DsbD [Silvibacterium bohemicum]
MAARFLTSVLSLLLGSAAWAAPAAPAAGIAAPSVTATHLTVQLVVPPAQIYPGQSFTAGLYFKLDPGWHVYWTNAGDSGEAPSIKWNLPADVTAGAMQFPVPKRLPLGPLVDFGYEGEVLFPIPVQVASSFKPTGQNATLGGKVTWLVCREVCIPGHADLAVTRTGAATPPATPANVDADAQLIQHFQSTLPKPLPSSGQAKFESTAKGLTLAVITGSKETSAQFFPFDQNILANAAPQTLTPLKNGVQISLVKDDNLTTAPKELHGLLVLGDGRAYEFHATPGTIASTSTAGSQGLLGIILFAFVGGAILNLMPCVFPVLFIKGLALVQSSSEERGKMRRHGLVYTLGILASFWAVVAALLILRGAGHQLGWGFQFQSPAFLALMALLLFFLGLSLAGQFEIGLTLTSAGSGLAQKSGYAGSFFTGVLAVIVATPCTAPFMGAAIGYALANSAVITFAVFTSLALGLAAPYLLLAFNPAWSRVLPRPGAWMEVLKQAVSIPIFGTVIWLVWVFNQTAGPSALVGLLSAFLLLAIAGWILGRWPAKAPATFAAAIVLLLAIAVPVLAVEKLGTPEVATATTKAGAAGTQWEPFTPELVAKYRAEGKPVFVDFTASWCLSCQVNERVVLDRPEVQQRLASSGVALIRADWTRHDEVIAQTLAGLGRSGVPTYAFYPADTNKQPQLLPEVLTPGIVFNALDAVKNSGQSSGLRAQVSEPASPGR